MFPTKFRAVRLTLVTLAVVALGATLVGGIAADAGAAGSNTLTVDAGEYTYKFSGNAKPGWIEIRFDNGGVEAHMMAIVGLKPGVTAKQLEKARALAKRQAFEKVIAEPQRLRDTRPPVPEREHRDHHAAQGRALRRLLLRSGTRRHAAVAHGMVDVFDIKGSKSSFKPPQDGVQDVTITDTAITLPSTGLTKTANVKVTNEGPSPTRSR